MVATVKFSLFQGGINMTLSNHLFFSNNDSIAFSFKKNDTLIHHYNKNKLFPSASLIKVPIMYYIFAERYHDLNLQLTLDTAVEGAGVTPYLTQKSYPVKDLVTLMIILSDNLATNTLIEWIGIEQVNQFMQSIGLSQTKLQRKMMDFDAIREGKDNFTSMHDMNLLLDNIIQHPHFEEMFDIMKHQLCKDKTLMYLDQYNATEWMEIGTKTGDLSTVFHEVGIIRTKDNIATFVALTTGDDAPLLHQAFHTFGLILPQLMR